MKIKHLIYILSILIFTFSCKKEETKIAYKPRTIKKVALKKFDHEKFGLKNMASIRSITMVDSTAFFAGDKGKIYGFYPNGNFLITPNDFFNGNVPNFRASAKNGNNLFALSIESPSYLYKIEMNKKDGLANPKLVYTEEGEKVFYDAIAFFDTKHGIAVGDPTEDCLSIITTNDGGNIWTKIKCENLPKTLEDEACFAASNTNIAIQGKQAWIISGGMQSRVFHTTDLGNTWSVYNTPLIYGKESTGGYSIAFADENNGIICGGDYTNKDGNTKNKAITTDGGKTWKLVSNGNLPGYISCVQYVPNTDGKEVFAVSTEGIYFSNSGGENWVKVNDEGYFTIAFENQNKAWLAGHGKIAQMLLK